MHLWFGGFFFPSFLSFHRPVHYLLPFGKAFLDNRSVTQHFLQLWWAFNTFLLYSTCQRQLELTVHMTHTLYCGKCLSANHCVSAACTSPSHLCFIHSLPVSDLYRSMETFHSALLWMTGFLDDTFFLSSSIYLVLWPTPILPILPGDCSWTYLLCRYLQPPAIGKSYSAVQRSNTALDSFGPVQWYRGPIEALV